MTDILNGLILGIVEGITEFIPVSSTGHLIIAGNLLSFNDERGKVFEVFIQLGAILAIVWLYRERLISVLKGITTDKSSQGFAVNIMTAFIPSAVFGLLFHKAIKHYLFNTVSVAIALTAGGIAIIVIEKMKKTHNIIAMEKITIKQAAGIGFMQCLSLIPGVSRSGATIMGGLLFGLERSLAAEFSFFLAVPTMFAATGYDLLKSINILHPSDIPLFIAGFISSFISALFVVRLFMSFISKNNFIPFAWYRIGFGLLLLALN